MNKPKILQFTLLFFGVFIAIAPAAQASVYRSPNGSTELRLVERNAPRINRTGTYTTRIGNQIWKGTFSVNVDGGPTNLLHGGTFQDSPVNNPNIQCTGNFGMTRTAWEKTPGLVMKVVWEITGGKNCPAIGKSFRLTLPEALPIADAKGDYNQSWERWTIVAPDRKLNCRATPNGNIVHTFSDAEDIIIGPSSANSFTRVNGGSWMLVPYVDKNTGPKSCYIRANSKWINPTWIAF